MKSEPTRENLPQVTEVNRSSLRYVATLRDIATNHSNPRRLFLDILVFHFHEIISRDSLNYFAPEDIMIGVPRDPESTFRAGVYGIPEANYNSRLSHGFRASGGRRLPLKADATSTTLL